MLTLNCVNFDFDEYYRADRHSNQGKEENRSDSFVVSPESISPHYEYN